MGTGYCRLAFCVGTPKFYFHLSDHTVIPDDRGERCATLDQAKEHATTVAAELGRNRDDIEGWSVVVTDEIGKVVFTTPLSDEQP
jgi:hypothetical protein